jgi:hypothetical protein
LLPRLLQSILRRRRRFGCSAAQHTSALTHHDKKKNQTSSHKVKPLQAAVSFHGCCNRFCDVVADLVAALHNTRQRWRREQQTTRAQYTAETEPEKILQGPVSSLC